MLINNVRFSAPILIKIKCQFFYTINASALPERERSNTRRNQWDQNVETCSFLNFRLLLVHEQVLFKSDWSNPLGGQDLSNLTGHVTAFKMADLCDVTHGPCLVSCHVSQFCVTLTYILLVSSFILQIYQSLFNKVTI